MPKSRNQGRSVPSDGKQAGSDSLPNRAEVERAIKAIVDRLAPKQRKSGSSGKTDTKAGARLRIVGCKDPGIR